MGIKLTPGQLRDIQRRAGYSREPADKPKRATKPRGPAIPKKTELPGIAHLFADIDPPTTTHHDKIITRRGDRPFLIDSPELVAARKLLLFAIPRNPDKHCLAGPIELTLQFWFPRTVITRPEWMDHKPDIDNACKAVLDTLVKHEWIRDDSRVTRCVIEKMWTPSPTKGIWIRLRTMEADAALQSLWKSAGRITLYDLDTFDAERYEEGDDEA